MTALTADTALGRELALKGELRGFGAAMVGFSAGVDSTYLLDVAHEVLGARVTAVTADSPSLARSSLAEAEAFCAVKGIRHIVVPTDEFEREEYLANDGQRCFHCKSALLRAMNGLARATAAGRADASMALLLGAIADDLKDYRPGMRAAAAAGARWPLADLGFAKEDVRARSRARGLASWNRPAEPCLSSRIPYGERVTVAGLRMIEAAEAELKRLGFAECRARHHRIGEHSAEGDAFLCRVEVPLADLPGLLALREQVVSALTALGYRSVTLDLAGLQSGGFNRLLEHSTSQAPIAT